MKIRDVTPVLLRGSEAYGASAGAAEVTDQGDWLLLVRVRTDEGLEGWADVETLGPVATRILTGKGMGALGFRTIAEQIVGLNPLDPQSVWDELYIATAYYGRRGVAMHCLSAVDNCLWSIAAQASGVPLSEMLGGRKRSSLPAYASSLFRPTPGENWEAARRYVELGYSGVKFGWGNFGVNPGLDRDNLDAIRDGLGQNRELMIDPGWFVEVDGKARIRTPDETSTMLQVAATAAPYWIEDFIHPESVSQYGELKADFPQLRFAAGEQQSTLADFDQLIHTGAVDVLQPDLSRCGGLSVGLQVRDRAGAAETRPEIVTHSWLTDLLHAYSLHYLTTLDEAHWVEFNVAQSELSSGVVSSQLTLSPEGLLHVPEGPGLGVEVDEDFLRERSVSLSAA